MGTRDWYLMHYSNPFVTRGQKHTHTNTKHKYLSLVCLLHRNKYRETPGINQPKRNTTMVELFAMSSGMAIANQLTPSPGAYVEGADQERCCRVLYECADRPRKN